MVTHGLVTELKRTFAYNIFIFHDDELGTESTGGLLPAESIG
jgi:hypothetical protein